MLLRGCLCDPKVDELDHTIRANQHIRGLKVTVDDREPIAKLITALMYIGERFTEGERYAKGHLIRDVLFAFLSVANQR